MVFKYKLMIMNENARTRARFNSNWKTFHLSSDSPSSHYTVEVAFQERHIGVGIAIESRTVMQTFIKLSTIVTLVDQQVVYKSFVPLLNIWLELQEKKSRINNLVA